MELMINDYCEYCGTNCFMFKNGANCCNSRIYAEEFAISKMESEDYLLFHRDEYTYYFLKRKLKKVNVDSILIICVLESYRTEDREILMDIKELREFQISESAFNSLRRLNLTDF